MASTHLRYAALRNIAQHAMHSYLTINNWSTHARYAAAGSGMYAVNLFEVNGLAVNSSLNDVL